MRKLIFILIALISFSQAQTIQYIGAPTTTVISRGNFRTDSIFYLPKRTKTPTDTAAFRYQISDSSLYYWTGYQWTKVQSASSFALVDTTVISTRAYRQKGIDSVQYNVGLKVNITDTSNMLSPYFRKVDTATLSNRINLKLNISDTSTMLSPYARTSNVNASLATKVNISDTSTMLSPYLRKSDTLTLSNRINLKVNISDTASMLTPYLRKVDTTAMLSPYYRSATATAALATKLNISDTSTMLSPYIRHAGYGLTKSSQALSVDTSLMATRLRVGKVVDSLGAIIATKGSGTVTSVATGYGLSGGTITTTGTISADTLNLSTRAWRQKGLDSLAALEISGSGTTNYVPKFTNTREIGNSVIYNSGGLVGINTASPVEMLSLSGGTGINFGVSINPSGWNGAKHRYTVPTSGDESVISHNYNGSAVDFSSYATSSIGIGNGIVRFSTGGINSAPTERSRFNAAGRFLINTTSDAGAYTLQNNGALYNTGSAILAATNGEVLIRGTNNPLADVNRGNITLNGTLSNIIAFTNGSTATGYLFQSTTDMQLFNNTATGNLRFFTNGTEYMRITPSGNIGIGTTSPAQKLDVSGITRVNGGTIYAQASGTESGQYQLNALTFGYDATNAVGWITAGGAAARTNLILQEGGGTTTAFVGIGTRTPTEKLHVVGNIYNTSSTYFNATSGESYFGTTTDAGNYRVQVSGNAYVTGDAILAATSGGVQAGTITTTSNYVIRAGRSNSSLGDNIINTVAHFSNTYDNNTNGTTSYPVLSLERVGVSGISNNSLFEIGLSRYSTANTNAFTQVDFIVRDGNSTSRSTLATFSNSTITFRTSDTERIRMHSNGGLKYVPQSAAPTAEAGTVYYDSDDNKLKVYNGTTWVDLH